MPKATELKYTDNELAALEVLKANRGTPLSAAQLGIKTAVLTYISKKFVNFPESGVEIHKEDREDVCKTCGAKHAYKVYWID